MGEGETKKPEMMAVQECLLDPSISIGHVELEGAILPMMKITHPRYGEIVAMLRLRTCVEVGMALTNTALAIHNQAELKSAPLKPVGDA